MASTLHTDLTTWRGTTQNHGGLAKQLNINGVLYDIQDPAVDQLATLLDTVIDNLETTLNSGIIGTENDATTANTIWGAKNYAKNLVDSLAGEDWSENAKKVKDIIDELEDSEQGNAWSTLVDKLRGLKKSDGTTATTVADYVEDYVATREAVINKTIEDNELVTSAALNDLQSTKMDKADLTTSSVNNWSSSYANNVVSLTSSAVSVYVPTTTPTPAP